MVILCRELLYCNIARFHVVPLLPQVISYRSLLTDPPVTTRDNQNVIVLILGAVSGIALIIVVTIVIMLAVVCYRNKVSHCVLCQLDMLNKFTKLQKQKINQTVEAGEFEEYRPEDSGSSHSHLDDHAREM